MQRHLNRLIEAWVNCPGQASLRERRVPLVSLEQFLGDLVECTGPGTCRLGKTWQLFGSEDSRFPAALSRLERKLFSGSCSSAANEFFE